MVLGIALTVAVIAFFVWNTQRAKNLIKSRYFREFGFDPEIDTMGGAALMDLNRWMDANLKRSSLKTALESSQEGSSSSLGLTPQQFEFLIRMELFTKIDRQYKAEGLTNWGGLAWFSARYIELVFTCMMEDDTFNIYNEVLDTGDSTYALMNKVCSISFCINRSIPGLKLTQRDMVLIERAVFAATKWEDWLKEKDPSVKNLMELMGMEEDVLIRKEEISTRETNEYNRAYKVAYDKAYAAAYKGEIYDKAYSAAYKAEMDKLGL